MKNTKNTRENEGKHERKSLKPTRYGHTCARSSKDKEIQDPQTTRDNTSGQFFSVRRS